MPEQSDFPPEWQCDSPEKRVAVEIRVPDREYEVTDGVLSLESLDHRWVEIPTTSVEQWVEKGDAADIQRTAKVTFPTEWGQDGGDVRHNSPRQLIDSASNQDPRPFTFARIWWQDGDGNWILEHMGWIGGVGATGSTGTSKFWLYDFAELLSSVPVGTSFKDPTVREALEEITKLTNDNSTIPVSDVQYVPPEAEELQGKISVPGGADIHIEDGEAIAPAESGNVLSGNYHVYETLNISEDEITAEELEGIDAFTKLEPGTTYNATGTIDTDQGDGENIIPDGEELGEIGGQLLDGDVGGAIRNALTVDKETQKKKFEPNHDTLSDVYNWLGGKIDGNLHFEPKPNSVELIADVRTSRRVFAQHEVIRHYDEAETPGEQLFQGTFLEDIFGEDFEIPYTWHENVTVIKNDALFEMKPINTLKLRGATSKSLMVENAEGELEQIQTGGGIHTGGFDAVSKAFPAITVQVPSLLEAAEGVELSPEIIESDIGQLDEAENEARKKMAEKLEEASEGEIILAGAPTIMPYDRVDAFEVCNDDVQYEQIPVSYEVESVKHVKESDGRYKTVLNVSVWANDKTLETTQKEMIEV